VPIVTWPAILDQLAVVGDTTETHTLTLLLKRLFLKRYEMSSHHGTVVEVMNLSYGWMDQR